MQLHKPEETISLEQPDHYAELPSALSSSSSLSGGWEESSQSNGWKPSVFPNGFDVWYPTPANEDYLPTSHDDNSHNLHPGSDYISNSVFSSDIQTHLPLSNLELHPQSQLHTQIIASSTGAAHGGSHSSSSSSSTYDHDILNVSDNIDFHNIADVKGKHSYGK